MECHARPAGGQSRLRPLRQGDRRLREVDRAAQNYFDRFAIDLASGAQPKGEEAFSPEEVLGLKLFIGKANCVTCHSGSAFPQHRARPAVKDLPPDRGRVDAVAQVEEDPFSVFRDGDASACRELRFMVKVGGRAYKTSPWRGAATPPDMHAGQFSSLDEVVAHYATAAPSVEGVSEVHPLALSDASAQRWWRF